MESWFTNPLLLLFALAAIVPWLLRWLLKPRYRTHAWGAMRLMAKAQQRIQPSLSWIQWLLLVIQTVLLLVLAIALASPRGGPEGEWSPTAKSSRVWWVLVIDDSYSMAYVDGDLSHFVQAKLEASDIVENADSREAFSLMGMSDQRLWQVETPSFNHAAVLEQLVAWEPTSARVDLTRALKSIEQRILETDPAEAGFGEVRIVFWSDFARQSWSELESEEATNCLERISELGVAAAMPVGGFGQGNASVDRIEMRSSLVSAGQSFPVWITLTNHDEFEPKSLNVRVSVDELLRTRANVNLTPLEERRIKVNVSADTPGQHVIEVNLDEDSLQIDNRRYHVFEVEDEVQVVAWTDQVSERKFIAGACDAVRQTGRRLRLEFGTIESMAGTNPRQSILILGAINEVTDEQRSAVESFVKAGGGVIGVAGPAAKPWQSCGWLESTWTNADLWKEGKVEGDLKIETSWNDYFNEFDQTSRELLRRTPVYRQWVPPEAQSEDLQWLLSAEEERPLLIASEVERGRAVLWLSGLDPSERDGRSGLPWSALGVWPTFPAMFSQMFDWVVGGNVDWNFQIGRDRWEEQLSADSGWRHQRDSDLGEGGPTNALAASRGRPGIYEREVNSARGLLKSLNVDTRESIAEAVPTTRLPDWFSTLQFSNARRVAETPHRPSSRWYQWLLMLAIVLLVAEGWIASRGAGRRRRNDLVREGSA